MNELIVSLFMLLLLGSNIVVPLLYAIPLLTLAVTAVAIVRRVKEKKRPSRAAVIFLSCGGLFALASVAMLILSDLDLSLYLFGVGGSVLCPAAIGLSALCLVVGALLLMKGVTRKFLVVILAVLLTLWLLVLSCIVYFNCIVSTYERIDENTVIETETLWHDTTVIEYEIIFPGLMKKVGVTYR